MLIQKLSEYHKVAKKLYYLIENMYLCDRIKIS